MMTDEYAVSENAWRTGGAPSGTASMFAALKSKVSVGDLVRGAAIQVANDACLVLAEGISGSESEFVSLMNTRAKAIGLRKSVFVNAIGLPQDGQQVTMREMALLANHMFRTYPEHIRVFAEPEFTWNKITQRNRNPLLANTDGVDGLGLGFTKDEGYAIVTTVQRGDLRLIAALSGIASEKERAEEARRIVEWGYSAFAAVPIYPAGSIVGDAAVFGGTNPSVPLAAHGDVTLLLEKGSDQPVKASIKYQGPLVAPVVKDQPVGKLVVVMKDSVILEAPLYAAESVDRGSMWQRAFSAVKELATGWIRSI